MAVMGFRLAQRANGVSQLHGHVSREMFHGLWPAFDEAEVPITSITNGVHAPTWVGREVFDLATRHGADGDGRRHATRSGARSTRRRPATSGRSSGCCASGSSTTPAAGCSSRARTRGFPAAECAWVDEALDPDVLTIGFARRVPSYKRLTLMLRDPERLKRLLLHPERPVQLVDRGQGAPGRRRRQEADPGARPVRRRPRGAPPHRLPAQLRHRDGAAALPRLRRLAQQPAAPLRGVRHVRHEGRAQRRAQPVDPRRLVGRVVRRLERLGDPVRRRRRRPPTVATTSRRPRSTT